MYTLLFDKSDILAAELTAAATTGTLTTGAFGSMTGTQLLVVDYDNVLAEVISCTITGTALSSLVRGKDGTSDVTHAAGAKVIMAFVPSHYGDLGKITAADAWTDWTPVFYKSNHSSTVSGTKQHARYQQIGKTVDAEFVFTNIGNPTDSTIYVTLPVTPTQDANYITMVGGGIIHGTGITNACCVAYIMDAGFGAAHMALELVDFSAALPTAGDMSVYIKIRFEAA